MSRTMIWTLIFYSCIVGLVATAVSISAITRAEITRPQAAEKETGCVRSWPGYRDYDGASRHYRLCTMTVATR